MIAFLERLSKRERILIYSALFILLVFLGRFYVVSDFIEYRARVRSQIEVQPRLLEKHLRYVSRSDEIDAELKTLRGSIKEVERSLLSGDTPSVSASALQEAVREIAAKKGTRIVSTGVLAPERIGLFLKIAIQVQISGGIDQVVHLIKEIESSTKLLVVSEVNIRSLVPRRRQGRRASPQKRETLRASFVISGFARSQVAQPLETTAPSDI